MYIGREKRTEEIDRGQEEGGTIKEWPESAESVEEREIERGREQRRREADGQRRRVMSPLTGSQ